MARGVDAATVEEYLDNIDEPFSGALRTVRDRIAEIVPESEQVIKYRVPIFRVRGKDLVGLSATAKECSLLLMSPPAASALRGTLAEGSITGATLHFAPDAPLSSATLRTIVDYRLGELA